MKSASLLISVALVALGYVNCLIPSPRIGARALVTSEGSLTALQVFSGISEKLGGIVELVSGQDVITETNIEDTLKEVKTRQKLIRRLTLHPQLE